MKLFLSEPKMNSFLLTALPEAVLRGDRRLLPWVYENFVSIYKPPELDSDVHHFLSALHAGAVGGGVFALCHFSEYSGGDRILRGGFLPETEGITSMFSRMNPS